MFAMIIYDCVKKDKDSLFYSILIACPLLVYMILYLGLPNVILIGFTIGIILLIVIYNWIHSFWEGGEQVQSYRFFEFTSDARVSN